MQPKQSTEKVLVRKWEASCTSTKAQFHVRMTHLTQGKALVERNVKPERERGAEIPYSAN